MSSRSDDPKCAAVAADVVSSAPPLFTNFRKKKDVLLDKIHTVGFIKTSGYHRNCCVTHLLDKFGKKVLFF